jgi:zinc protease
MPVRSRRPAPLCARIARTACAAACLLLAPTESVPDLSAQLATPQRAVAPAFEGERVYPYPVHERVLDNGLRVLAIPTGQPDVVSLQIPVAVGSRNEVEPGKSGFAHFFEHMMFRGSENYSADAYGDLLKNIGADQNAYTTDDRTVYHTTFTKADLELMMELEADRFQRLQYAEPEFRTEALAVLGEYNKNSASPLSKLIEVQRAAAFQAHTYRHTTMGFLEDIERMPEQYAYSQQFYERFYRPENTSIVVSGDVDPENVFALAEQYWGSWAPGAEQQEIPVEPAPDGPLTAHVDWPTPTTPWTTVAFRGPAAYDEAGRPNADMQALDLLSRLAFSSSSPLYRRLVVEEQLADQLWPYFPDRKDPGLLMVAARVKDPANLATVRDMIQMEMARLRAVPFDEDRLAAVQSNLRYGFAMGLDDAESAAAALVSDLAAVGRWQAVDERYAAYASLTAQDVQRAAERYFTDQGMIVTTLAHGEISDEAKAAGSVDQHVADAAAARPDVADPMGDTAEKPVPPQEVWFEHAEPRPMSATIPFRVVTMPTENPVAHVKYLFMTGAADDPPGKEGLAQLTAMMVADAGSEQMKYGEIQEALFPMASWFSAQVDKEMTVFQGATHLDNLDGYHAITAGQLLTPAFREEDFSRVKSNLMSAIRVGLRASNDEELGKEVLYEMAYAGHPYGHLTMGHLDAVENLTLDDVRGFYENHYTQANLTLAVAGPVDDKTLATMKADLAAHLPPGDLAMEARTRVAQPAEPEGWEVALVDKDTRATAISIGFPIEVTRGDPDWVALYLIRSYFGEHRSSNSYLYQQIRETRGMNYGDYAYVEYFPRGMYQFHPDANLGRRSQLFQVWIRPVPPEQAHFALRITKMEMDRLYREGLSEEDFEATRNYLMKFTGLLVDSPGRSLGYRLDSDYYGTPDFVSYVRDGLERLTLEEVNAALRRHLNPDNAYVAVITPDAEELKEKLLAETPSPMTYASPKPAEVLEEDEMIQTYPLGLDPARVQVIPVDEVFRDRVFVP